MSGQDWNEFAANMQQFGQNMSNLAQRMTITARQVQFGHNNFQSFGGGNINFGYGYTPENPTSSSSTWTGNVRFVSTGDGQVFINGQRVHPPANSSTPGTPSSSSTAPKPDKPGSKTEKPKRRPECKNPKKTSKKSGTGPKAGTTKPSAAPLQESSDDEFHDAMEALPQN